MRKQLTQTMCFQGRIDIKKQKTKTIEHNTDA